MLNIYIGSNDMEIYNTSMYFDHTFLDSWLENPLSKRIIKSIDKADVVGPQTICTKALGVIPVTKLSGGAKTLLLLQHDKGYWFNASTCGDNCSKWILKIAKESKEDINITLHHIMDFGEKEFEAKIVNTNTIVHNMDEFASVTIQLLHDGETYEG